MVNKIKGHFFTKENTTVEKLSRGIHHRFSRIDITGSEDLLVTRVDVLERGNGHNFHYHPTMEEVIYVIAGKLEMWLENESCILEAGEAVFIPRNTVHASYNYGNEIVSFLAILAPGGDLKEDRMIDVFDEEPWRSLKTPV
jgi:quercetin dioxygenase-like cupin family protein